MPAKSQKQAKFIRVGVHTEARKQREDLPTPPGHAHRGSKDVGTRKAQERVKDKRRDVEAVSFRQPKGKPHEPSIRAKWNKAVVTTTPKPDEKESKLSPKEQRIARAKRRAKHISLRPKDMERDIISWKKQQQQPEHHVYERQILVQGKESKVKTPTERAENLAAKLRKEADVEMSKGIYMGPKVKKSVRATGVLSRIKARRQYHSEHPLDLISKSQKSQNIKEGSFSVDPKIWKRGVISKVPDTKTMYFTGKLTRYDAVTGKVKR